MDPLRGCQYPYEMTNPAWLDAAKESGRIFKPLKPEHGWLEFVGGDRRSSDRAWYPVAIHSQAEQDQATKIDTSSFRPWLDQKYKVRLLRYEAFKNAYLLALNDIGGTGRNNGGLWWLYPDGRLERILVYGREGNWKSARYYNAIPTKTTFLLVGTETHPFDKSGLYRQVAGGELELADKGWAAGGAFSLSPDGCKLAYGIDPKGFPNTLYRLHVLDVCQPGK